MVGESRHDTKNRNACRLANNAFFVKFLTCLNRRPPAVDSLSSNISILAYSPLEQGLLTGKIGMDRKFGAKEHRNTIPWFKPENRCRVIAMLSNWQDLTAKYKCSVGQLVIAWTLAQPGLTFTLCGARHSYQVEENAGAGSLTLSAEDIKCMRKDIKALGCPL